MGEKPRGKRGAPRGNVNALKNGYYSRILNEAEMVDFALASGIEGIDDEIALLRLEIKKAIAGGDDTTLRILVKGMGILEKLVRTRYQITASQRKGLKEAIQNVIRDIFVPLGVNVGSAVITKKLSG